MMMYIFRWSVLSLAGFVMWVTTGCTRWIDVKPPSASSQESLTYSLPGNERVPLVIETFHTTKNGAPQHPSPEAERRILNSVQVTSLFSTLIPLRRRSDVLGEKIVSARITVDEAIEPHSGLSALKGMLIGGSMFFLSPFINLEYDYAARVGLELERWDGYIKRYETRSSGTVHYKLFGATPVMIDELKGHVTEACLADLTGQLVRDAKFYMGSSASVPATGIRTVTVRANRPPTASLSLSIIPIASASSQ